MLILLCWMTTGFAIFGPGQGKISNDVPPPTEVNRIVSLAPNLTEILFALGLEKEVAGVTLYSNYPPAALNKPKIGTFWQLNVEAVIATRPDLVLTLGFEQQNRLAGQLKRIGYNCLMLNVEKVDELFVAIEKIGAVTGKKQQADELTSDIRKKLDSLSTLIGNRKKIRVLWVVQREPLRVAGRDTFVNEMIELAGGENAIGPTVHQYPPIGAEQVIACRADVIIEPAMNPNDLTDQQKNAIQYWSRFKNVPAVTDNRIYVINGDTVSRLGPRLYEGTELIARCLRPELFTDFK